MAFFYSNGKDDRPLELFKIIGKIAVEGSKEAAKVLEGVGNVAVKAGKAMAAGLAAGTAAVAALTKQAVESYAEYEQLVGGVETLFGTGGKYITEYAESVGKTVDEVRDEYQKLKRSETEVMKNAANAYKTAGLSANAYIETVTSFSASLIQSLKGDTEKAAKVADQAIIDMSDNANKMGTSIEMIQNAYNGFAKGNFTMLDNLKLGYGGTQEEMQRLLKDAKAISGVKYNISSFADIAEAIHVIQDNLGITGTTMNEAATTIQGSLGMLKGAWQNLVTGMADETAHMNVLIDNFVESTLTVADNIMPRIEQALIGIGSLVAGLAPIIAEKLPGMVESVLPTLLTAAVGLLTTVFNALPGLINSLLPVVVSSALDVLFAFLTTIRDNFGMLVTTAIDAIMQLVDGLLAPGSIELLLDTAAVVIDEIVWGLIDALPKLMESAMALIMRLVDYITDPNFVTELLRAALEILKVFAYGLIDALPQLVNSAVKIVNGLYEFLLKPENIAMLLSAAVEIILALASGLISSIPAMIEATVEMVKSIINTIIETDWGKIGGDVIDGLKRGISEAWEGLKSWFNGLWDSLFGGRSVDVSANGSSYNGKVNGSHASGLDYVPYDGYIAELHRGEMVVPASEARMLRGETKTADSSNVESLLTMILSAVQEGNMREPVLKFKEREVARMVREYA